MANDPPFARLNHLASDLGIPRESATLRIGISRALNTRSDTEFGHAQAQYNLGVFHENGRGGFAKNDIEAARLYKLAADQGHAQAQYNLGRFYEVTSDWHGITKDDAEAARLYKLAADQGYAPAQIALAPFYAYGRGGLARNGAEAARLYKLAADQAQSQAEAGAKTKDEIKPRLTSEFAIQEWVNGSQLVANPFSFKGKVIAFPASFVKMLSENEALFVL